MSEPTARWGGEWADGLATVNAPVETLERLWDAFGGEGRRVLQVHVSWAPTQEEARADRLRPVAHERLRPAGVLGPRHARRRSTRRPKVVRPEDLAGKVLISSDLEQHVAWLQEFAALGFDDIAIHHVGQDLDPFIDAFGEHVLPQL